MDMDPRPPSEPPDDDAATGVPMLRTWRAVYLFVGGVFVLWLVLLTLLTRWFA
jgi:hypothetical protein